MMDITGLLLAAGDDFGILPELRGWVAAAIGIPIAVVGGAAGRMFGGMASKSRRNRRLLTVLAWTGGALFLLGCLIVSARICGEPCENWVHSAPGMQGTGYCAD